MKIVGKVVDDEIAMKEFDVVAMIALVCNSNEVIVNFVAVDEFVH